MSNRKRKRAGMPEALGVVVAVDGKKTRTTVARFCVEHANDKRLCAAVRALTPGGELEAVRDAEMVTVERPVAAHRKRRHKVAIKDGARAIKRSGARRGGRRRVKSPHKPLA